MAAAARPGLTAWRALLLVHLSLAASTAPALAQERKPGALTPDYWVGLAICPRDQVAPRDYNRCLYDAQRTSEAALEAEVGNAIAVIESRADLVAVQRSRWKNLLDEAQSRFLIFRNFDCQSVAPFEGKRGIGNFEQRTLCLIEVNSRRARELRGRYGTPLPAVAEGAKGPQARPGAWVFPTSPPVD